MIQRQSADKTGRPFVSVIIPAFNAERYIGEAVASVLGQEFRDFQVLVVDDGSTDRTTEVLSSFSDHRLRVIRQTNGGVSSARNTGLRNADGRYVAFLDADDRWRPQMLERAVSVMEANPDLACVFSNFVRFTEAGETLTDQFQFFPELTEVSTKPVDGSGARVFTEPAFETLVRFGEIPAFTPAMVFRTGAIKDILFDEELTLCEDTHFCLRVFMRGTVAFTPEVLLEVRRHGGNATINWDVSAAKLSALRRIDPTGLDRGSVRALRKRIGREWVNRGRSLVTRGQFKAAGFAYYRAFRSGFRRSALFRAAVLPAQVAKSLAGRASRRLLRQNPERDRG